MSKYMYCISPIRRHGYYFFAVHLVWLLFEGGVYFVGMPVDSNNG